MSRVLFTLLTIFLLTTSTLGSSYKELSNKNYLTSLSQPDNSTSCCGEGDAYVVKSTLPCTPKDLENNPKCTLVAILDKQPSSFQEHQSYKLPEGFKAIIPTNKVRKHPIPNPTGYDIIFLYVYPAETSAGTICWEPASRS